MPIFSWQGCVLGRLLCAKGAPPDVAKLLPHNSRCGFKATKQQNYYEIVPVEATQVKGSFNLFTRSTKICLRRGRAWMVISPQPKKDSYASHQLEPNFVHRPTASASPPPIVDSQPRNRRNGSRAPVLGEWADDPGGRRRPRPDLRHRRPGDDRF